MADLGTTTYTAVTWAAGDVITEAKLDNMVANDQAYDSHAAQGLLLNNNKAYAGKKAAGTNHNLLKLNASDILELSEAGIGIKPMITSAARGDVFYLDTNLLLTRLAAGTKGQLLKTNGAGADPSWASPIKILEGSRDLTAASGAVAYTGLGFQPTGIIVLAGINGAVHQSWGFANSVITSGIVHMVYDTTLLSAVANRLIHLQPSSGNNQIAVLTSYDADGFTLTWTKTGSPTGTGTLLFLCYA